MKISQSYFRMEAFFTKPPIVLFGKSFAFAIVMQTLFLLNGCNSLYVFLPGMPSQSASNLKDIEITEDGQLSMSWTDENSSNLSSYEIYLMETASDDLNYRFTEKKIERSPLSYETIEVSTDLAPYNRGVLLKSVSDLSYVLEEILEIDKTYAIQIIDRKTYRNKRTSNVFLVHIAFDTSGTGTAENKDGYIQLNWSKISGANRYEVYADEEMTLALGQSSLNELRLKTGSLNIYKEFYVKAYRGQLTNNKAIKIVLPEAGTPITNLPESTPIVSVPQVPQPVPSPSANAGIDLIKAQAETLIASVSNAQSSLWTKVSGPGNAIFANPHSAVTTVGFDAEGIYVLRLTATNSENISVSDDMTFVYDSTAPSFAGISDLWQNSADVVRIFWTPADDNLSPHNEINYELCYSSSLGSCANNFVPAFRFPSNVWDKTISGLTPGLTYEFMLRAIDLAGNVSYGTGAKQSGGLQNVQQIAGGGAFTCALLQDGSVKCWGRNNRYQLGQGGTGTGDKHSPTLVPSLSGVKRIAVGNEHACAIMSDNSVKCWGSNSNGAVGDGSFSNRSTPTTVTALTNIVDISAGNLHSCAINSSGNAFCWGRNDVYQLGNGLTADSNIPVQVNAVSNAQSISSGNHHNCVILSDKTMKCWGRNQRGQVGNGTSTNVASAISPSINNIESIELGEAFTCAIVQGGALYCWGYYGEGNLGMGSLSDDVRVPTAVPSLTTGVSQIALGYSFACALMSSGSVKCWGDNSSGQLGNGTLNNSNTPIDVANLSNVSSLAAGNYSICATLNDGRSKCWGSDAYGQLGDGRIFYRRSPIAVANIAGAIDIQTGIDHSCALLSDRTVKCWGANEWGQLGSGLTGEERFTDFRPRLIPGLNNVELIRVGAYHSCALLSDSSVKCWGRNDAGQLGINTTTSQMTPATVLSTSGSGSLNSVVDLALGYSTTCAVLSSGVINCWGRSGYGLLADGRINVNALYPVVSTAISMPIKKMVFGYDHICFLMDDSNKSVQCLGSNYNHQLGDGSSSDRLSPVVTLQGASDITSFNNHSCALMQDKTVQCWGNNSIGELGVGDFNSYDRPRAVSGLSNVLSVKSGTAFNCALLSNSQMKCWGEDDWGRLNNPAVGNQNLPLDFIGLTAATNNFNLGYAHGCMIMADQTVRCWGYNNKNQLGNDLAAYLSMLPENIVVGYTLGD